MGVKDAKTTLNVSNRIPSSQARVIFKNSFLFLNILKAELNFFWKWFHFTERVAGKIPIYNKVKYTHKQWGFSWDYYDSWWVSKNSRMDMSATIICDHLADHLRLHPTWPPHHPHHNGGGGGGVHLRSSGLVACGKLAALPVTDPSHPTLPIGPLQFLPIHSKPPLSLTNLANI